MRPATNNLTKKRFTKHIGVIAAVVLALLLAAPAWANECQTVGGMLMTNIGAIEGVTNLGPVTGDLQGSIAATIKGQDNKGNFLVQHYWVTSAGETILLKEAVLTPTATNDPNVVAVLWGNYSSDVLGGTGKFAHATGRIDYFGIADFKELTLVMRYRGRVCR